MTQLFGRFTAPGARFHVPGAAFFASATLAAVCWVLYFSATRERTAPAPASVAAESAH
jgi:hypothetical protein